MKNSFVLLFSLLLAMLSNAQSSLDSLRLVLPIGHTASVISAVYSPDGKYALTASDDKTARIYEVSSGKELQEHPDMITSPSLVSMVDIESVNVRMAKQRRIASWSYVFSGLLIVTGGISINF